MTGYVHSIESMGLVDGPGVRSVVFMQGCKLRCAYCHNPDTWALTGAKLELTPQELANRLIRFKDYFGKDGGVTISGGEPLLQAPFVTELFRLLKRAGIHTCLDTAGVCSNAKDYDNIVGELLNLTDLVLLDVKHYDSEKYLKLTGRDISSFNRFINCLNQSDTKVWIRHVVVPSLTDGEEHIKRLKEYSKCVKGLEKIELLPYHTLGVNKYKTLNIKYGLEGILPPDKEEMKKYNDIVVKL